MGMPEDHDSATDTVENPKVIGSMVLEKLRTTDLSGQSNSALDGSATS